MRFTVNAAVRPGTYEVSSPDLPDWKLVAGNSAQLGDHITTGLRVHTRRAAVGANLTPSNDPAPKPTVVAASDADVVALPVSALFADPTYQRPLDDQRVARMAEEYDPALIGVLEVSARPDGRYALVDGQHRWALLRNLADEDEDPTVLCHVHHDLTVDDEAALFFDVDAGRRQLTGWDRWVSRRGAGDPVVLEIEQVLTSRGLRAGDKARGQQPVLRSTVAAEAVLDLGGSALLGEALDLILAAWGPDPEALTRGILEGAGFLLTTYPREQIDLPDLIPKLQRLTPRQINARATGKREQQPGTQSRLTAAVIVDLCNTSRPGRSRLDPNALRIAAKTRTPGVPAAPRSRPCAVCETPLVKKPGRGRWPVYCPGCRDRRRRTSAGVAA